MKKALILIGCLCVSIVINAQGYRGSDADRMMQQRKRQYSQQNAQGNTYVPRSSYGSNNSNSYNNSYGRSTYQYSKPEVEKVVQGAYVNNGQLALIRLRYYSGKITHYSISRDILNREQWQSIYPDSPHPTNSMIDGQLAREYKYKISVQGTNIYFNL